ncbi:hypothetical protein [Kibdelosporangium philippinense]|uniref:hypothetical protein n=1 Tax=Kibdelosporangium philippinense TaxID=211113 RepID=UPI003620EC3C
MARAYPLWCLIGHGPTGFARSGERRSVRIRPVVLDIRPDHGRKQGKSFRRVGTAT